LLEPSHPEGGPKARWFKEALGFTKDNMQDLGRQLVFDESKAAPTERTQWGQKFVQIIDLEGANGRTIPTSTIWIKKPDGVVDFVTAIPAKK